MTPSELLRANGLALGSYDPGRHYTTCPRCSAARKHHHQKLKCVGVTITPDKVFWGCNHCGWTGPEAGSGGNGGNRPEPISYCYGENLRKVRNTRPGGSPFFWQHLNGGGIWEPGLAGAKTGDMLYRIDEVKAAMAAGEPVLVVEGEKDVNTCWRLGFAATCNAHGASQPDKAPKWTAAHSEQLRGANLVVLWDNDAAGRAHRDAACSLSLGVAASVRLIDLSEEWPDIKEGDDVTDWVSRGGGNSEQLEALVAESRHVGEPSSPAAPIWDDIAWDGIEVPTQQWTVPDLIPANEVCLFSGYGGGGKSTIGLHLAAAHAIGLPWLNVVPEQGPAFFIDAEDHIDVIHRRLAAITRSFGCTFSDLVEGGLKVMSLHGKEAVMATADKNNVVKPTKLYETILRAAEEVKPSQIIIAPSSHVYGGSEIDRSQVTQFVSLLSKLAVASGGSVILISHPSLTGMTNQSGISGSTGWHNAVRARMYLETLKNGEGADEQPEHEVRVLRFLKNQYGPPAREITLRYQNGMFLPEPKPTTYETAARDAKAEEVFVNLLRRITISGRPLTDKSTSSSNYAPKEMAKEQEAKDLRLTKAELEGAMRRLFKVNRIRVATFGAPSRGWTRIEET